MFKGIFGKTKENYENNQKYNVDEIKVTYEGAVMSAEYEAETINRNEVNNQNYPYHVLAPHGFGKISYKFEDKIIEEYEGNFEAGQYHGKGKLIWESQVFEGEFKENKFIQ